MNEGENRGGFRKKRNPKGSKSVIRIQKKGDGRRQREGLLGFSMGEGGTHTQTKKHPLSRGRKRGGKLAPDGGTN